MDIFDEIAPDKKDIFDLVTPERGGVTGEWEEEKEPAWKQTAMIPVGGLEAAATLVGGVVSLPIVGIAGLAGLPFGKAEEYMQNASDVLVWKPRTKAGEKITEVVSTPFRWINEASTFYGDMVFQEGKNPHLAAGVATAFELAAYALLAKGVKGVKGRLRAKPPNYIEMANALDKLNTEPAKVAAIEIRKNPTQFQQFIKELKKTEPLEIEPYELARGELPKPKPKIKLVKGWQAVKPITEEKMPEVLYKRGEKLVKREELPRLAKEMPLKELMRAPKRKFTDIAKDVNSLVGEKGMISFKEKLTPEQLAAKERLSKDLVTLNEKAKIAGKGLDQYLKDKGMPANMIRGISQFSEKQAILAKEEEPKYAQSINLQRQDISESGKALEMALAKEKKPIGWKATEAKAEKILEEPQDLAKTYQRLDKISEGKLTADIQAAKKVNAAAMDELGKVTSDFIDGKINITEFNKRYQGFEDSAFYTTSKASSEIGRALNIHKTFVSGDRIIKGIEKLNKDLNARQVEELAQVTRKLGEGKLTSAELKRFLQELPDPALKDYILEFWYNSILSGLPTHAVNIVSNTFWSLYQVPHRIHVGLWDKLYSTLTGKQRTRLVNETIPMMAGYAKGAKRGIWAAGKMIKKGEIGEFETKWAQEVGYRTIGAWEKSPHKWMRIVAPGISFFTRALRAADVWANSISYDGEMASIARRLSKQKALKGEAARKFEIDFAKEPPDWAHEAAMKQAKHSTFMDDPDPFTQAILKLREAVPYGIGRFIVPFVNTIGNLTKRGIEFTPGLGILKEAAARKMGRGMGTPELIAKQVEGALLTLYILHKCEKGEIIGRGGKSKAERERLYAQGKKPWSIKIGDKWYQYRRIEPFNTPIATVAIVYDEINEAKDDATKTEIFMNCVDGMVNNLIDSSYFQGIQQVLNKYEKRKASVERFGASFVPYSSFWRSVNRAYEKQTEGEAKVREKRGWLSALAQVIPGISGKIPAELDAWGEEKVIPGSVFQHWLPYKWSKEIHDPVEDELERLNKTRRQAGESGLYPGLPRQTVTINGKKTDLDDDIYRRYCVSYGHRAKAMVSRVIQSSGYQKMPDDLKLKTLDRVLRSIRTRELQVAKIEQNKKSKKTSKRVEVKLPQLEILSEDYLRRLAAN